MQRTRTIGAAVVVALLAGLLVATLAPTPAAGDTTLVDYTCDLPGGVGGLLAGEIPDTVAVDDLEVTMVDTPDPVVGGQPIHYDIDYPVLDPSTGFPPAPDGVGGYGIIRFKYIELTAPIPAGLTSVAATFEQAEPWASIAIAANAVKVRIQSPVAGSYIEVNPDVTPPTITIDAGPTGGGRIPLDSVPSVDIDGMATGAAGTSIDWRPPTLTTLIKYSKVVGGGILLNVNWNDANLPCAPNDPSQVVVSSLIEAPNPRLGVTTTATEDRVEAGEDVHYEVRAVNTGNIALTGVAVTDAPQGCAGTAGPLAVGASAAFTCTVTTDLGDVGLLSETATADSAQTAPVTSMGEDVTVTGLPAPAVTLAATEASVQPGQVIHYTLRIRNGARVLDLTGLSIVTTDIDCAEPPAAIDAGATAELACVHTTSGADEGDVEATVTVASAEAPDGVSNTTSTTLDPVPAPTVTLTLDPGDTTVVPGETIHYGLAITEHGLVPLTGLSVVGDGVTCDLGAGTCEHLARNWELGPHEASVEVDSTETGPVTASADVAVIAIPPHGFADVAPTAFFDAGVSYAKFFGLVTGFPGNLYQPLAPVNRGQIVNMLWQLMGRPAATTPHGFSDVPANAFYGAGLNWAKAEGLVSGFPQNRYRPRDPVNRCQLANMAWNMVGAPAGSPPSGYTDVRPTQFCRAAVDWARAQGLLTAFAGGTSYRPTRAASRGEVAHVLHRLALTESAWGDADTVAAAVLFAPVG